MSDFKAKICQIHFGWGSAADLTGGAYSAPTGPLAGLRGPTSKGRGRDGKREGEGRRGEGEGELGGVEGRDETPPLHLPHKSIFPDMPLATFAVVP